MHDEVEILRAADPRLIRELSLVLKSVGIQHRVIGNQHQQWIATPPELARPALEQLARYQRENAGRRRGEGRLEVFAGAAVQALLWAVVLALFHSLTQAGALGVDWRRAGAVDGALLRSGEWWRPVTALCLHSDLEHLISNLCFGALFVALLHQVLGPALTWTAVLLGGALGNALNAGIAGPELRSLGASTAVFAALGALTAVQWSRKQAASRAKRWIPLIAGLLLLGWNGMGGAHHDPWRGIQLPADFNTDVGAHVAGFLCGLAAGVIAWRLRTGGRLRSGTEALLLWAAPVLVALAWCAALLAAR